MPLVQAAQLQLESSRHNLRDMEIEIETELHNNYVMAKYAEKRIALYRERILPRRNCPCALPSPPIRPTKRTSWRSSPTSMTSFRTR